MAVKLGNDKKVKAAQELAKGMTMDAAATNAGITPRTLYRLKREPEFAALVERYSKEAIAEGQRIIQALARPAAITLGRFLQGVKIKDRGDGVSKRLQFEAAKDILTRLGFSAPTHMELTGKDGGPLFSISQVNLFLQESVAVFQRVNQLADPVERERQYALEMDKLVASRLGHTAPGGGPVQDYTDEELLAIIAQRRPMIEGKYKVAATGDK